MQETSGIIRDCRNWGDRKWQQVVGITKDEALRECPLWTWDGDDIHITAYNEDNEQRVKTLRTQAVEAGKRSGEARRLKAESLRNEPNGSTERFNRTVEPKANRTVEQKKRKERKRNEIKKDLRSKEISFHVLQHGSPLPSKCLPIDRIIADQEHEQIWEANGHRWSRVLGDIADEGPVEVAA
jgi:hypothetical protein